MGKLIHEGSNHLLHQKEDEQKEKSKSGSGKRKLKSSKDKEAKLLDKQDKQQYLRKEEKSGDGTGKRKLGGGKDKEPDKTPRLLGDSDEKASNDKKDEQSENHSTRKFFALEDKGTVKSDKLRFGTAEAPELFSINHKKRLLEQKQEKLGGKLKYDAVAGKSLFGRNIRQIRTKRLIFPGEKTVYDSKKKRRHRFFFKEVHREKATEKDYKTLQDYKRNERFRNRVIRGKISKTGHKLLDDESIKEDENMAEMKAMGKKYYRGTRQAVEQSIRNIKLQNNPYARLNYINKQQQLLQMKKNRLLDKAERDFYKGKIKSASSQYQKRKLKKEMASAIRKNEGNLLKLTKNQFILRKKSREQKIRMVKRITTTVLSSMSLVLIVVALFFFGIIAFVAVAGGLSEYTEMAVTQNDYTTLSDSTAYLKKLETDLEESLTDPEKLEELEEEWENDYGPGIDEYVYAPSDAEPDYLPPEFGFSSTTLMAYLSAKYGSFTLDQVKDELDLLFAEMYSLDIEVKDEQREGEMKKICYVTLEKKELEEVIDEKMSEEEKERYATYKLSSGGQQVYGPVMVEDWTNLITSDYGERIHPVTGERTFHNGVDIGIPTGTNLYSAVTGTVTVAQYSETAGNYVRVQTDSGWVVTFMHMDTLAVSPGQEVEKGDFLGHSGNTGRSTGPHLHLEVRDANGNPINPVFIVPQNCYQQEENNP